MRIPACRCMIARCLAGTCVTARTGDGRRRAGILPARCAAGACLRTGARRLLRTSWAVYAREEAIARLGMMARWRSGAGCIALACVGAEACHTAFAGGKVAGRLIDTCGRALTSSRPAACRLGVASRRRITCRCLAACRHSRASLPTSTRGANSPARRHESGACGRTLAGRPTGRGRSATGRAARTGCITLTCIEAGA